MQLFAAGMISRDPAKVNDLLARTPLAIGVDKAVGLTPNGRYVGMVYLIRPSDYEYVWEEDSEYRLDYRIDL